MRGVVLEDGASVNGTWTMQPAGHEILDRLWDEVRFDAVLADGVPYVAHARLYARWPHGHSCDNARARCCAGRTDGCGPSSRRSSLRHDLIVLYL